MEDHDSSQPSVSHRGDVIDGKTVAHVLRAARMLGNKAKEDECLIFLRDISAPKLVGEIRFMEIGNEFDIDFIKERSATLLLFASIGNAISARQRVHCFRRLPNCNFVGLLDSCEPTTPVGMTGVTDRSVLRVLRWGYKQNNLLVLKEYEYFLASPIGQHLFNTYQLLHMANRFDFPHIRIGILMNIRTIEEIEAFKREENYELQLSIVDKELFDLRADIIRDNMEKGTKLDDDLFTYDVRNGCSAVESCLTRYVELSEREKEEILEVEDSYYSQGLNSEVTGMIF